MEKEPLVTIIVPTFNRESTIVRCLDSIAAQEGIEQCQLIVVDNNSKDDSIATIQNWAARHNDIDFILTVESKAGATAARNKGLSMVHSPYVLFFDSDDIMLYGHIKRLLKAIGESADTDIFGWDIECELRDGRSYRGIFACKNPLRDNMIDSSMSTQRYAVKTSLIRAIGGWDESVRGWNDFELGVRLVISNPVMRKLPDPDGRPLVKTFFTADSITGKSFSSDPDKWETSLNKIENTISQHKPTERRYVAYRRAVLAGQYAREGAKADAERLLNKAIAPRFGTKKARAVYLTARIVGRGTRLLGKILL